MLSCHRVIAERVARLWSEKRANLRRDARHSASVTNDEYRASNDRTGRIHAHNRLSSSRSECRDIASGIGSNGQLLHSRRRGSRYSAVVTPSHSRRGPANYRRLRGKKKVSQGYFVRCGIPDGLKREDQFLISLRISPPTPSCSSSCICSA